MGGDDSNTGIYLLLLFFNFYYLQNCCCCIEREKRNESFETDNKALINLIVELHTRFLFLFFD